MKLLSALIRALVILGMYPLWRLRGPVVFARNFGGSWDGTGDDTAAIDAAVTALGGPGTVVLPNRKIRSNTVLTPSGVMLQCQGWGSRTSIGNPTAAFWRALDPTKPALQIGDGSTFIEGSGVRDVEFFGAAADQIGIKVVNKANRNLLENVRVSGFTNYNVGIVGGPTGTCAGNRFIGFVRATVAGSRGFYAYDGVNDATNFTNDNWFEGYLGSTLNSTALHVDGSTLRMAGNPKIDCFAAGVVCEKSYAAGLLNPTIYGEFEIDGNGSPDDVVLVSYAANDLQSLSSGRLASPIADRIHIDGVALYSKTKTTGTISSGSNLLTLAASGLTCADRTVLVLAAGKYFSAVIQSISGAVATLKNRDGSAFAAPVAAAGAVVYVGDAPSSLAGLGNFGAPITAAGLNLYDGKKRGYGYLANKVYLFGSAGLGAIAPYSGNGLIWEFGQQTLTLLSETATTLTPDSVVRSGNVVTITRAAGFNATPNASWIVILDGANEAGFNSVENPVEILAGTPTTITYVSNGPDVTATGALKVSIVRQTILGGAAGVTFARGGGPNFNTQFGVKQPFTQSTSNSNFITTAPDSASGTFIHEFGSALINTASAIMAWKRQGSPFTAAASINGGGGFAGGASTNPYAKPGFYFGDAAGDSGNSIGTDGLIYVNGGVPKFKTGSATACVIGTQVAVPSTAASTGTPGQWAADPSYVYICTAASTWKRAAIATW